MQRILGPISRLTFRSAGAIALAGAITFGAGCGNGSGADGDVELEPVTIADVFNIDDVILEDNDASAAAIAIGDPASLLAQARQEGRKTTALVRSVLERIKNLIGEREPDRVGETDAGRAYGVWEGNRDGVDLRLVATRIGENRVRYLLVGVPEDGTRADARVLLTGVFVRSDADDAGERSGGGRVHVSLRNATDLFGGDVETGSLHVTFANHRSDAKGRRVVYRNMRRTDDPEGMPARNYGVDVLHRPGQGGRIRALALGDLVQREGAEGIELAAVRARWVNGVGGRAQAVLAHVAPAPRRVMRFARECWDADGNRSAYLDDDANNDDIDGLDEGDTGDATFCGGLEAEPEMADDLDEGSTDGDPELEELLEESGADDISEEDAANDEDDDA